MDDVWFQVLVVVLSIVLALYLVLSIILTVKLIQIAKSVKRITEHAESVVDKADHITTFFEKTATPVALIKLLSNVSDVFNKNKKGKN